MDKIVEVDVDGVLLDIYSPVEQYLSKRGIPFSFESNVITWGMTECGGLEKDLKKLLIDPKLRSESTFYPNAVQFVKDIATIAKDRNWRLVFNSHEFRKDTAKIKAKIIEDLISDNNLVADYVVSCGVHKEMLNSHICIDDSIPNIEASKAKHRIIFGMFHNTPMYNKIPKGAERIEGYNNILERVRQIE